MLITRGNCFVSHFKLCLPFSGFAESISFSVSAVLPPSPIPPNSTLHRPNLPPAPPQPPPKQQRRRKMAIGPGGGQSAEVKGDPAGTGRRRSKRLKMASGIEKHADIVLPSPEAG